MQNGGRQGSQTGSVVPQHCAGREDDSEAGLGWALGLIVALHPITSYDRIRWPVTQ
jgi:hypothetical protein